MLKKIWKGVKSIAPNLLDFGSMFSENRDAKWSRRMAREQFDAQMDQTIQRRVADAEKAGIHPLFALGASSGASPTSTVGSGLGDALGRTAQRLASRDLTGAELRRSEAGAKRDEAEAAYIDSRRKQLESDAASRGRDGVGVGNLGPGEELIHGPDGSFIDVPPMVVKGNPNRPAVEAGPPRSPYVKYRRDDGSTGLAFGAEVPGAEEINFVWIPLQNWWHSSKEARRLLREKLGVTSSEMARMRSDPKYAEAFLRRNKGRIQKMKREFARFREAASGRPTR